MTGPLLIVGSGAREHALAWALATRPGSPEVLVMPGNPAMADVATVVRTRGGRPLAESVVALALERDIGLVVVGPEAPLVAGLADELARADIPVFGPSASAARLEGSKAFCREVADAAGVPMAAGDVFEDPAEAVAFARRLGGAVAVKADGLAGGKGVTVCASPDEADAAIRDSLVLGLHGAAGRRVVVERALQGPELSVIAICDASACLALPPARDHKRLLDGDRGPNTGGMGAVSPPPDVDDALVRWIVERFHRPVLAEMVRRGQPFRGALYAGLMLTDEGPVLLEINVRLGDPEAQAVLPRLGVALAPLMAAAAADRLADAAAALGIVGASVPATDRACAAVVLAAPGYPAQPVAGASLPDLDDARVEGCLVFAGGVAAAPDGSLVTAGGRVLTVVGRGPDLESATDAALRGAARAAFAGALWRRDIGRTGMTGLLGRAVVTAPPATPSASAPPAAAGSIPR